MKTAIELFIGNFPLIMVVLSFIIAFAKGDGFFKRFLACLLFLAVGLSGVWGFIMHAFFPQVATEYAGWKQSHFEFEVAIANLSIGITGIIAAFSSYNYRRATITTVSIFLLGTAIYHIYQIKSAHNFDPGNASSILLTDILVPIFLWLSLTFTKKSKDYSFITPEE